MVTGVSDLTSQLLSLVSHVPIHTPGSSFLRPPRSSDRVSFQQLSSPMSLTPLPTDYHYLRILLTLPARAADCNVDVDVDVLTIRKALQDALSDTFGITSAGTYIDVLAVTRWNTGVRVGGRDPWGEVVLRVHPSDAPEILAAITAASPSRPSQPRFSLLRESSFLPSLSFGSGGDLQA